MHSNMRIGYKHPGLGDDTELVDHHAKAKMAVTKWVAALLERHHAGHPWYVVVRMSATGGLIQIRLNGIMPANRWYVVKLSDTLNDPGGRTILKGCGELLERYKIRRGNFNLDDWRAAMNAMPLTKRLLGRGHVGPLLD